MVKPPHVLGGNLDASHAIMVPDPNLFKPQAVEIVFGLGYHLQSAKDDPVAIGEPGGKAGQRWLVPG
ncbi:unnamed protein product [marine sediment metagenome]|uniref:Uncharacterized protein n=1 Tax=marine sediment metagenome TaxID=412755 RepID=X0SIA4_9ZZZZ